MRPCATSRAPRRSSAATQRLRAVRRDIRDPGPLRALVGDVRPEELYNLAGESSVGASFRRPAGDVGVERARRRPPARRDPARQPGDPLLPGLVRRDVRLGARRERRPRRVVGSEPAEPVRGGEGGRAHALQELPRVVRDPDRVRDPLQPRVAPSRFAVPLAEGGRPRPRAAHRRGGAGHSRSAT